MSGRDYSGDQGRPYKPRTPKPKPVPPGQLNLFDVLAEAPPKPPKLAPFPVEPTAQRAKAVQDAAIDLASNDGYGKWFAFHLKNPHVYEALRWAALDAASQREVFGISPLVERLRWDPQFTTRGENYKFANAHRAPYARMLMEQEPGLAEFFHIGELRSGTWPMDPASVAARARSVA